MEGFDTIINNILLLTAVIAIGFAAVKTGYLRADIKNALSAVIVRLTLPLLILNALTRLELTQERIYNAIAVLVLALLAILILYLIGILSSKLFHMPEATAIIHRCMMSFGNVAFLGYPLISALFGEEGLFYAAVFQFVNDIFVWTFVVCRLNRLGKNKELSLKQTLKNIINPCTIAFFLSFIMMLCGFRFSGLVLEITTGIGGMTTYLSMLFIGMVLAEVKLGQIKYISSMFVIIFIKMLFIPTAMIFVIKFLPLDLAAKGAVIMQIAVPSQTIISVLTLEYGGDTAYTSQGILITTLAGLITMPAVYYIMNCIF